MDNKIFVICLLFIIFVIGVTFFKKHQREKTDYTLTVVYISPYEKDSLYDCYTVYQSFDYGKTQIFFDILDEKNKFQIGQEIKLVR